MRGRHERAAMKSLPVAVATLLLCCGLAEAAGGETLAEHINRGLVEMIIDGDAISVGMASDLASVVDDGATRRLLPVIGHGGAQDVVDLKALRGVDIGIIQTDVLDQVKKGNLVPGIENVVTYVAKLHNEELHLLARAEVARIQDLAGKKVGFVGGAAVTGQAVLNLLHVKVEPLFVEGAQASARLASGELAAIAYVAAKPAATPGAFADGLHFLPVPLTPELAGAYVPARFTSEDYPGLVSAAAPVDTVAVGMVMVVANLQPRSERYRNVANFVDALFTQFPRLQDRSRHPKWSEVNLSAELPGWRRFPPADAWLKRNVVAKAPPMDERELREIFAKFVEERSRIAGGHAISAEEKDQLFDQFRQWENGTLR
jgi:uncharacterized protein